jgi:hypothetical protein
LLNITEAATRARIRRATLRSQRDEDGNVFVLLEHDDTAPATPYTSEDGTWGMRGHDRGDDRELIDTLQEQLRLEREASAELRRIIAVLSQRHTPELEAPRDERGSATLDADDALDGTGRGRHQERERRSWWRRFFGVE